MSVSLQACPYCPSLFAFHSAPIHSVQLDGVYLCNTCGLVYKPTSNPMDHQYSPISWSAFHHLHEHRMNELAMTVNDLFPSQLRGNILDIGAGTGMLYDALSRKTTIGRYVAIEPVPEIASVLHKKNDIMVLNSDINSCELPENAFDFVFVCGVDYLFKDIRAAFGKIVRTLKNGGIVAVQRNVFIDQTAYVGSPIRNFTEMFDANPLMRNWFHSEQYRSFLDQFFDITHSWRRHHHFPAEGAVAAGFVDTHIGYKTDTPKHEVLSWLETNERIVKQLGHG